MRDILLLFLCIAYIYLKAYWTNILCDTVLGTIFIFFPRIFFFWIQLYISFILGIGYHWFSKYWGGPLSLIYKSTDQIETATAKLNLNSGREWQSNWLSHTTPPPKCKGTSMDPRKLIFGMQVYFDQTWSNMKKKIGITSGVTCPPFSLWMMQYPPKEETFKPLDIRHINVILHNIPLVLLNPAWRLDTVPWNLW